MSASVESFGEDPEPVLDRGDGRLAVVVDGGEEFLVSVFGFPVAPVGVFGDEFVDLGDELLHLSLIHAGQGSGPHAPGGWW